MVQKIFRRTSGRFFLKKRKRLLNSSILLTFLVNLSILSQMEGGTFEAIVWKSASRTTKMPGWSVDKKQWWRIRCGWLFQFCFPLQFSVHVLNILQTWSNPRVCVKSYQKKKGTQIKFSPIHIGDHMHEISAQWGPPNFVALQFPSNLASTTKDKGW